MANPTQNGVLQKDDNGYPVMGGTSSSDNNTIINASIDPITRRLLTDPGGGTSGILSINADTTAAQLLVVGTSGTDFAIADNGTGTHTFNLPTASATNRGALSSTDWSTFNSKQAAGNYITALTGDVTATGPGSVAATLATVNSNVGSFTNASITVNAKGLITAASSGAAPGDVSGPASSTDNAIVRFDGTTGKVIQNSVVTVADTTGALAWDSGQNATLTAAASRSMILQSGGATTLTLDSSNNAAFAGGVAAGANAAYSWVGRSSMLSPSDGVIELANNAGTAFTRLQFGGTTSSFPSIKRNSAALDFRLADDSGYANVTCLNLNAVTAVQTGNINSQDNSVTAMTVANTTGVVAFLSNITPQASDGGALGTTAKMWSDLFLASGGVINFNNGNATLTHSTGLITSSVPITVPQIYNTPATISVSSNAGTVTRANRINNFTNSSAATMTITMSTTGAVDGDMVMVVILDASAAAQTITWVNTENSTISAPTTSNGSTTLPLTVGFKWNAGTSKWRCIASA